jgi:hypothetical protein
MLAAIVNIKMKRRLVIRLPADSPFVKAQLSRSR